MLEDSYRNIVVRTVTCKLYDTTGDSANLNFKLKSSLKEGLSLEPNVGAGPVLQPRNMLAISCSEQSWSYSQRKTGTDHKKHSV